mmetsp:Transcript_124407/g.265116  ORF Transcript_124407/g.265116 Transcript_124407/m.265116 type:complete len:347 (+) Transcript_124407:58-1098(+)
MAKGKKAAESNQAGRKAGPPVKKVAPMTPKAAKDITVMKKNAELLKMEKPADWPADAVPNARAFAPLPDGWRHAMRVTGKSGRGNGGNLRHCYIGPGGVTKWHKTDLEKFLGVKIPEGGTRPRSLTPLVLKEFPAEAIIKRTGLKKGDEYILKRCDALDGKTVSDALLKYQYKYEGEMWDYTLSDLRYDIKNGRLVLPGAAASVPPTSTTPTGEKVKVEVGQPMTPPKSAPPKRASSPTKTSDSKRARSKPASLATSSQPEKTSSSSNAGLQHVRDSIFTPLLHRAVSGAEDEMHIFTLKGVGTQLNMEKLLLSSLPEVLRTPPAERGVFGDSVLKQFEAELNKHL